MGGSTSGSATTAWVSARPTPRPDAIHQATGMAKTIKIAVVVAARRSVSQRAWVSITDKDTDRGSQIVLSGWITRRMGVSIGLVGSGFLPVTRAKTPSSSGVTRVNCFARISRSHTGSNFLQPAA